MARAASAVAAPAAGGCGALGGRSQWCVRPPRRGPRRQLQRSTGTQRTTARRGVLQPPCPDLKCTLGASRLRMRACAHWRPRRLPRSRPLVGGRIPIHGWWLRPLAATRPPLTATPARGPHLLLLLLLLLRRPRASPPLWRERLLRQRVARRSEAAAAPATRGRPTFRPRPTTRQRPCAPPRGTALRGARTQLPRGAWAAWRYRAASGGGGRR